LEENGYPSIDYLTTRDCWVDCSNYVSSKLKRNKGTLFRNFFCSVIFYLLNSNFLNVDKNAFKRKAVTRMLKQTISYYFKKYFAGMTVRLCMIWVAAD